MSLLGGIGMGINLVGGVGQLIAGALQRRKLQDPTYEIPNEVFRNQMMATNLAMGRMPGAGEEEQFLQQMASGAYANINRAATDPMSAIMGSVLAMQKASGARRRLGAAEAQSGVQRTQMAIQANRDVAQERRTAFNINEMLPFRRKMQDSNQLIGAGLQNIGGGLQMGINMEANSKLAAAFRQLSNQYNSM